MNQKSQTPRSAPRRLQRAYTLTELMVAVAIVALLSGIGLAAMSSGREERAMRRATATLVGTLQDLRAVATSSGRAVVVNITQGDVPTGQAAFVRWWFSTDNTCAAIAPLDFQVIGFRPRGDDADTRNVVITRVAPQRAGSSPADLSMCITPEGRVVDPATGRPLARLAGGTYDGQAYFELRQARCGDSRCEEGGYVTTVSFGFNGAAEVMAPGFRIP